MVDFHESAQASSNDVLTIVGHPKSTVHRICVCGALLQFTCTYICAGAFSATTAPLLSVYLISLTARLFMSLNI